MIRGIIFDCFGVLYGGSLSTLVAMAPPDKFQAVHDVNLAKDYGYIDYQQYLEQVAALTDSTPEKIDAIIREYHAPNGPLLDYALSLKEQYKTALLSNIGDQAIDRLFDGEVEKKFTEVVLSYREGIAKPNPEIFTLVAERLGLSPGECVMIDDITENCEGAEIAGMASIQHVNNATTIEKLEALLKG